MQKAGYEIGGLVRACRLQAKFKAGKNKKPSYKLGFLVLLRILFTVE